MAFPGVVTMKRRRVKWTWEDLDAQDAFYEWVGFPDDQKTSEEVDKIEALLNLTPPLRVLDVGCGTGRHSLELCRRGYRVTGIDVAGKFLAEARREAASQSLDIEFREQRGAELRDEERYDFILAYYHNLGFLSDEERSEHFDRIRLAMKSTGKLLLVLAGPKLMPDQSFEKSRNWGEKDGKFILSEKHIDDEGYRNEFNIVIDTNTLEITDYDERQRAFSLDDVVSILGDAGFSQTDCFADLQEKPASPEEFGVFVCRR